MTSTTISSNGVTRDAWADALLASFERAGYARVTPPILQPAEPFLDLSGEDIRKRMYLTTDPQGRELCLRPDLTIPVSRDYLASDAAGKPAGYCYLGPVFRAEDNGGEASTARHARPGEFMQAGIESFGRPDTAAADAEMLALGLEATSHYGLDLPQTQTGDVGLYAALVAALELAPIWKRRLMKDFNRKSHLAHDLERLALSAAKERPEYQGVLSALAGSDPKAARALVTDLLSIAGIRTVGGRSVGEIADRFLEQAAIGAGSGLPHEIGALIQRFLAISRRSGRRRRRPAFTRGRCQAAARCRARPVREPHRIPRGARRRSDTHSLLDRIRPRLRLLHRLRVRVARPAGSGGRSAGGGRPLRRAAHAARQRSRIPAVGFAVWIERLAARRRHVMSAPFIIAVPSKGRLHENAVAFFARAGLELTKPRGERDYRGTIADTAGHRSRLPVVGRDRRTAGARRACISA